MADPYRWGDPKPRAVKRLQDLRETRCISNPIPPGWECQPSDADADAEADSDDGKASAKVRASASHTPIQHTHPSSHCSARSTTHFDLT